MERKESNKRSSSRGSRKSSSKSVGRGNGGSGGGNGEEEAKVLPSVIVNERSKYESKIRESTTRITKYTTANDRLLDEVSDIRLEMREMKND